MQNGKRTAYEHIARYSFIAFLFFTFFGTSMPFKESVTDVDNIGTSNIINQLVFSILFLASSISLIPQRKRLVLLLKREKFLSLFLLWCLLSVFWSDFSFVSFKRLFQIFVAVSVSFAVLLHTDSLDEVLHYFKLILAPYVIISILSVLLIPGAVDAKFDTWRGLTPTKNNLGQAGLVCVILWFNLFRQEQVYRKKVFSFLMVLLSAALLLGSQSGTSLITFTALISLTTMILILNNVFQSLTVSRFLAFLIIFSAVAMFGIAIHFAPDLLLTLPDLIGKDITFTGRVDLWIDIFEEAQNHFFTGCGYAGFWVVENVDLLILYEKYVWLPNQSHSGYIDILNETGIIGLTLLFLMIIFYYKNLFNLKVQHFWKWFILATLMINLQETTFFRPRHLIGTLFIFSYLALYIQLIPKRNKLAPNNSEPVVVSNELKTIPEKI